MPRLSTDGRDRAEGLRRRVTLVVVTWPEVFDELGVRVASRHELLHAGASGRGLTAAVRFGHLIRVRRDHYALPGTSRAVLEAVRIGGRLGCVSALEQLGLFAFDTTFTHAHVTPGASRLRHPRDRHAPLNSRPRDGAVLHWSPLLEPDRLSEFSVGALDALSHVVECGEPHHAVASIDSALHHGAVSLSEIDRMLEAAPQRLHHLRELVDPRAEAGQETVLRLILRAAGLDAEPQVTIPGVGRVDFVVEGCLVLEADSRQAHDGWELHLRDRDRDLDLARLGFMSLRPAYRRIMFTPNDVRDAVVHLLRVNRNFRRFL